MSTLFTRAALHKPSLNVFKPLLIVAMSRYLMLTLNERVVSASLFVSSGSSIRDQILGRHQTLFTIAGSPKYDNIKVSLPQNA